ncbi:hypothetical protein Y1Q_0023301 [Alligator mississippiensis]|uniref:Uncharacterized protein n=1 Tax=Alligator mississippiensis TaxID=8496 RepID=A0A151NPD7_ALLMI|nr:hypothetical protein Y1Q_0023301 [Alligator mississippiensis]
MGRGSPAPFLLGLVAKTSVKMKIFFSVLNKHLLRQSGIYRNDEGSRQPRLILSPSWNCSLVTGTVVKYLCRVAPHPWLCLCPGSWWQLHHRESHAVGKECQKASVGNMSSALSLLSPSSAHVPTPILSAQAPNWTHEEAHNFVVTWGPTSGHRREAAGPCMSAAAGSPPPATRAA